MELVNLTLRDYQRSSCLSSLGISFVITCAIFLHLGTALGYRNCNGWNVNKHPLKASLEKNLWKQQGFHQRENREGIMNNEGLKHLNDTVWRVWRHLLPGAHPFIVEDTHHHLCVRRLKAFNWCLIKNHSVTSWSFLNAVDNTFQRVQSLTISYVISDVHTHTYTKPH